MKKIKVKRELLADWLAALRSGKYQQGTSTLVHGPTAEEPLYCCLGVKLHVESPEQCNEYFSNICNDSPNVEQFDTYTEWARKLEYDEDFLRFLNHKLTDIQIVETLLTALNDGVAVNFTDGYSVKDAIKNFVSKRDNIAGKDSGIYTFTFPQIADFIEEELVEYID